jgi:ketosteroid isomerase-like protein
MLRTKFSIIAAALLAAASIPAIALPKAETEIRAVIQAQQEAWNRGNIDGFMNGYARGDRHSGSDTTTFVSGDSITRGWQTVRDRYKKKYSDREKMGTLAFSDLEIRPLSHDAAIALGRWKLKRAKDEPHGRFTLIFRRTPEGWRIIHDHTSVAE